MATNGKQSIRVNEENNGLQTCYRQLLRLFDYFMLLSNFSSDLQTRRTGLWLRIRCKCSRCRHFGWAQNRADSLWVELWLWRRTDSWLSSGRLSDASIAYFAYFCTNIEISFFFGSVRISTDLRPFIARIGRINRLFTIKVKVIFASIAFFALSQFSVEIETRLVVVDITKQFASNGLHRLRAEWWPLIGVSRMPTTTTDITVRHCR